MHGRYSRTDLACTDLRSAPMGATSPRLKSIYQPLSGHDSPRSHGAGVLYPRVRRAGGSVWYRTLRHRPQSNGRLNLACTAVGGQDRAH